MKLQRSLAAVNDNQDELNTEINDARNWDYLRGVKRRFVRLHDSDDEERKGLFLETKWELEISMKRREVVSATVTELILITGQVNYQLDIGRRSYPTDPVRRSVHIKKRILRRHRPLGS